jgi:hypothetical protein
MSNLRDNVPFKKSGIERRKAMKTILSTLVLAGVLATAAKAQSPTIDPFFDPNLALPHSEVISGDEFRQALPRSEVVSGDQFRQALPNTEDVFPDITIATP